MKSVLKEFMELGRACPECGQAPELLRAASSYDAETAGFHWTCKHCGTVGFSESIVIATLKLTGLREHDLGLLTYVIDRKRKRGLDYFNHVHMEIEKYDTQEQLFGTMLHRLAKEYGIKITDHISNGALQFEILWRDIVSRAGIGDIQRWLSSGEFNEHGVPVLDFMEGVLQTELQQREGNSLRGAVNG